MSIKKSLAALAAGLGFCLGAAAAPPLPKGTPTPPAFVEDEVLVAFKPGTPAAEIAEAHRLAGGLEVASGLAAVGVRKVKVPAGTVLDTVERYKRLPLVHFAEPNYLRILYLPREGSDTTIGITQYFNEQWGLHNTGQALFDPETGGSYRGAADADIDAPEAWDIYRATPTLPPAVKVGILDTGVVCNHVDLQGKCVESRNFSPSTTVDDILGHGTHVAGIVAAITDNGLGVAGASWNARVGNLKVCYEWPSMAFPLLGMCPVDSSANALIYAADQGYQVVNMSYGSDPDPATPTQTELAAVNYAWNKGVVLVAAAGNNGDTARSYPAAFDPVIAVAATDHYDNLASFSTFGKEWVDVAAPGNNILSTLPDANCGVVDPVGCYGWYSGTSMASPMVAGVAALVKAYKLQTGADAGAAAVRAALENNADRYGALGQDFSAWTGRGRVNAARALSGNATPPPATTITLAATNLRKLRAGLAWNTPAAVSQMSVYRNTVAVATVSNTGSYTDRVSKAGTYTYKVCTVASQPVCSNNATVNVTR